MNLADLLERLNKYRPHHDLELVKKAYSFAERAHMGQHRRSGEDYVTHPLEVAAILCELEVDEVTVAAALLHDVVEDTPSTLADIDAAFGEEVAGLVDGVTKLSRIEYKSKEEQQVNYLRKMFLAMATDLRVILIKLADRLHNMRTLEYLTQHKQREIAEETLEIYAPLAHRLGIFRLKWELEDLAFRYQQPGEYYRLAQALKMKRQEREAYIAQVIEEIKVELKNFHIEAEVTGRPKHLYSIYNKMLKTESDLNEIYDLVAVRILVENVKDCYGVLGIVHTLWKPIPGRFKDYIAMPKPNMYQSLHTTVIGPHGTPFEAQIRTWEMHHIADYGVAAHWRYKENDGKGDSSFEKKLSWLRQLIDWQRDMGDAREFIESVKVDFFSDRVYVFTPRGAVIELPVGSVPLDFAYRVHTDIGHRCIGAKINGRIVNLDYNLKTGDIVEILTVKSGTPSRDWLNLVRTSQAKNRIRQWFKKAKRGENAARGKEILDREVKKAGDGQNLLSSEALDLASKRFSMLEVEDLYAAIGDGTISALQVITRLKEFRGVDTSRVPKVLKPWTDYGKSSQGVRVQGLDQTMVRLSRCCNPLPGDEITGFVTRGRGVSVHRVDCPNIIHHFHNQLERVIEVAWDMEAEAKYQVQLEAIAFNRPRLATDVMTAIADSKTIINAINARATKNNLATIDLKVEVRGLEHLQYIMDKVKRIRDVLEVRRVTPHETLSQKQETVEVT